MTYDLALSTLDLTQVNQMGVQITTGTCLSPIPDAGSDAATQSDATSGDAASSEASMSDVSVGDGASSEASTADAGADASDAPPPPPPTATTAVILIDNVVVFVP